MRRALLLSPLFLFCIAPRLAAQSTGTLSGHVTESDGRPIIGATVVIEELGWRGYSQAPDGAFTIDGVPFGTYTTATSLIGFHRRTKKIRIDGDLTTTLDITLFMGCPVGKWAFVDLSADPLHRDQCYAIRRCSSEELAMTTRTSIHASLMTAAGIIVGSDGGTR